jgi:hypothetical protein
VNTSGDDVFRGVAVGAMFVIGMASLWLFSLGGLVEGVAPSDATGELPMLASLAGLGSAWVAGHGIVVGAPRRAATAAAAQGITALLVLVWWVATDFWGGTAHSEMSSLPLVAVLILDAAVLVWAWPQLRIRRS